MSSDSPYESLWNESFEGVVRRETTIYRKVDNRMVKEVVVRKYFEDGDYIDTKVVIPL